MGDAVKMRRRARIIALQALFEVDVADHDAEWSLQGRLEEAPLPPREVDFARSLVLGVLEYQDRLDEMIHRVAPEWPVDQIAPVARNTLRIAIYELTMHADTPPKVAINEAVELAKMFGSESSRRFINGVVGTLVTEKGLAGELRPGT